jgi:hypothetical protein
MWPQKAAAPQHAVGVAAPQESMKHLVFSMSGPRRNGWKIGYVAVGLLYALLSQVYVPYAIRFVPLAVWGAGVVVIAVAGRRSGDALRRHRWKFGFIAAWLLYIPPQPPVCAVLGAGSSFGGVDHRRRRHNVYRAVLRRPRLSA